MDRMTFITHTRQEYAQVMCNDSTTCVRQMYATHDFEEVVEKISDDLTLLRLGLAQASPPTKSHAACHTTCYDTLLFFIYSCTE